MEIRFSAHGAYHHQYHVGWIPKSRQKILKGDLKVYLENGLFTIQQFHREGVSENFSLQVDHVHLIRVIPPKYAVSALSGKLKANPSREVRARFPWLKKV